MSSKVKSKTIESLAHDVEQGSGNVFADLNLPDPEERQLRVQLPVGPDAKLPQAGDFR
jgi:hypothetical protein